MSTKYFRDNFTVQEVNNFDIDESFIVLEQEVSVYVPKIHSSEYYIGYLHPIYGIEQLKINGEVISKIDYGNEEDFVTSEVIVTRYPNVPGTYIRPSPIDYDKYTDEEKAKLEETSINGFQITIKIYITIPLKYFNVPKKFTHGEIIQSSQNIVIIPIEHSEYILRYDKVTTTKCNIHFVKGDRCVIRCLKIIPK
jgi:hypothetical protein